MLKTLFTKRHLGGFVVALLLFRLALSLADSAGFRKVEWAMADAFHRLCAGKFSVENSPIVIVEIDDASNDALSAVWPWPRSYYARLVRNLTRAGARVVALDIMLDNKREDFPEGDDSLAAALADNPNVILAGKRVFQSKMLLSGGKAILAEATPQLVLPHERFLNADSSNWGLIDTYEDPDGTVREYFHGASLPEDPVEYPSLATRVCAEYTGNRSRSDYPGQTFRVAFPGPQKTFTYRSFVEVIDDSSFLTKEEEEWEEEHNWFDTLLQADAFRDKIVLVGSSMWELHDIKLTPFSTDRADLMEKSMGVPGVEVHAAALHTLLNDYRIADVNPWVTYPLLACLCLVLSAIGMISATWVFALCAVSAGVTWLGTAYLLFDRSFLVLPKIDALLAIGLVGAGQSAYLFYLEQMRRRRITGMFGRYVPKQVVTELIKDPRKMKLGGEKRDLTVIFSDLEGFTSICESLKPEEIAVLLNEYLTAMTEIVHEHGGIIDKYEGDLIMAEFGIPLLMPDHALRACRTAFYMRKRLHELHDKWAAQGKPRFRARIGIGSGPMVFGNMGSHQAFDYTVIGDVVNLASRLEGANKNYGTYVMINQRAFELTRTDMISREMDLIRVKGKQNPERCFHLMAPTDSPKAEEIRRVADLFTDGVNLYRDQLWDRAMGRFQEVLGIWPDDRASEVYLERCRRFLSDPPGDDWDGVFTMQTK